MIAINETPSSNRSPHGYKVAPISRRELRKHSVGIRQLLKEEGCYKDAYFINANILLETTLRKAGFEPKIESDDELPGVAAYTDPVNKLIVMRESVYEGLACDDSFSRFTVLHEFSHIVLCHGQTFHRDTVKGAHNWYEDSEWQANNLAGEIMMPVEAFKDFGIEPYLIMSACGVGAKAFDYRLKILQREGVLDGKGLSL